MTPEQTAQVCARLLGWTWWAQRDPVADTASGVVYQVEPGRFTVVVLVRGDEQARYTVDLPTLMLCAMLRHAGDIDVGPCTECEGFGQLSEGACPECLDGGRSTRREVVTAWRAVLMGSPSSCEDCDGMGWTSSAVFAPVDPCNDCERTGWIKGHEGARAALARLAEEWRESLPVLADWAESVGWLAERRTAYDLWFGHEGPMASDRTPARFLVERCAAVPGDALELARRSPPVPRPLAECPALPVWLDAWLAGPCADCRGHGRQTWDSHSGEWMPGDNGVSRMQRRSGVAIGPHLDAMSAHLLTASEVDA